MATSTLSNTALTWILTQNADKSDILTAYARAIYRLNAEGVAGAKTVFDIAPAYLSPIAADELRAHFL